MFERQQIEKFLNSHGIDPNLPDEELRVKLISAQWHNDDIDAALYVLRDANFNQQTQQSALRQLHRTDDRLRPETIKALLGIDVDITAREIVHAKRQAQGGWTFGQVLSMFGASLLIGFGLLFVFMWLNHSGPFHFTKLF